MRIDTLITAAGAEMSEVELMAQAVHKSSESHPKTKYLATTALVAVRPAAGLQQ